MILSFVVQQMIVSFVVQHQYPLLSLSVIWIWLCPQDLRTKAVRDKVVLPERIVEVKVFLFCFFYISKQSWLFNEYCRCCCYCSDFHILLYSLVIHYFSLCCQLSVHTSGVCCGRTHASTPSSSCRGMCALRNSTALLTTFISESDYIYK